MDHDEDKCDEHSTLEEGENFKVNEHFTRNYVQILEFNCEKEEFFSLTSTQKIPKDTLVTLGHLKKKFAPIHTIVRLSYSVTREGSNVGYVFMHPNGHIEFRACFEIQPGDQISWYYYIVPRPC